MKAEEFFEKADSLYYEYVVLQEAQDADYFISEMEELFEQYKKEREANGGE